MTTAPGAPRLPSLPAILAFDAAIRLGSFERAGEQLNVTASAIGKRIGNLEQLLGTRLLERTGNGVRPTTAGLEYAEQVREALSMLTALPLHRSARRRQQTLRLCAPPTFAREIVVPELHDFARRHPGIDVDVVLSVPHLGLRPPGAHIEVVADKAPGGGEEILGNELLRPICSRTYAAELGLAQPADLRRARLIRSPIEPWSAWFAAAGLDWHEPDHGLRFVDSGLAIAAAAAGLGVTLARPSLYRRYQERGEVVALFDVGSPPTTRYTIRVNGPSPHETDQGDAARAFAAWLRETCAAIARSTR